MSAGRRVGMMPELGMGYDLPPDLTPQALLRLLLDALDNVTKSARSSSACYEHSCDASRDHGLG